MNVMRLTIPRVTAMNNKTSAASACDLSGGVGRYEIAENGRLRARVTNNILISCYRGTYVLFSVHCYRIKNAYVDP